MPRQFDGFGRHPARDQVGEQAGEAERDDRVGGRLQFLDRPPPVAEVVAGWLLGATVAVLFVRMFVRAQVPLFKPRSWAKRRNSFARSCNIATRSGSSFNTRRAANEAAALGGEMPTL